MTINDDDNNNNNDDDDDDDDIIIIIIIIIIIKTIHIIIMTNYDINYFSDIIEAVSDSCHSNVANTNVSNLVLLPFSKFGSNKRFQSPKAGPIEEPTVFWLESTTGTIRKTWGDNR